MHIIVVTQRIDETDGNLGFFVQWVRKFAEHGSVTVIANEVGKYHLQKDVRVLSLGKEENASRFTRFFRYQRFLFSILREADGVFFHMCPEFVLGAHLLPKLFKKKTALWYVHKEVSWRLWLSEKLVNKIFTASKESFRLKSKKAEIVGHGIDTDIFSHRTGNAHGLHLVTVGRISLVKDLQTIIGGFLELKKMFGEATLSIIGDALTEGDCAYSDELIRLFSDRVRFQGSIEHKDLPKAYGMATVFVHASRTGSMDKAVLEALASGLPVFTSSEAFAENIPGITKFAEGNPIDLSKKMLSAYTEGKIVYNEKAQEFVIKHHSLTNLINSIVAFY